MHSSTVDSRIAVIGRFDCIVPCIIPLSVFSVPSYDSGDHLAVYPVNNSDLVERLGQRLGADLGVTISLTNVDRELLHVTHSTYLSS